MTTFKTITEAHARITQLEQANAALHEEADTWWEALAMAVRKNDALQAEVDRLTAITTAPAVAIHRINTRRSARSDSQPTGYLQGFGKH